MHTHRQHNVNAGAEFLANRAHNGKDAVGDLGAGVGGHVVRADHQDDAARPDVVQFAVLQAPERVLRLVGGDAEVQTVQRRKVGVPDGGLLQLLQDAVADEDDVRVLLAALGQEALVLVRGGMVGML